MKPWLDDLSEEWVVQDNPAPPAAQDANEPPEPQTSQSVPPKLHSRLPRLRQSSGSFSEIRHSSPKYRSALAERRLSEYNVSPKASAGTSKSTLARPASRSFSGTSSQGSVVYNGTVAQKPIPASAEKEAPIQNTPEWRRRLLKGEVGYGEQKDLFSPMGLENIFQKPSGSGPEDSKQGKSKLGLLKSITVMPSSPPPWPKEQQNKGDQGAQDEQSTLENDSPSALAAEDHAQSASDLSAVQVPESVIPQEAPRTTSGQIEFENENFSPVTLPTNIGLPTATPKFAHRLRQFDTPHPTFHRHPASEDDSISQNQSRNDSSFAKLRDDTLPEDLPAGTPDVEGALTPFVETRRGGYAQDDYFQRRPLSPSPQPKAVARRESDALMNSPEGDRQRGGNAGAENARPALSPMTPRRQFLSPARAQTSGSPLKLFDAHDTFTSNRLQRRLSQLEHRSEKPVTENIDQDPPKKTQKGTRMISVEEVSIQQVTIEHVDLSEAPGPVVEQRRVSTFGEGQLDRHEFPDDFSVFSSSGGFDEQDSAPDGSPSMDVAPPGSRQPLRFESRGSPQSRKTTTSRRQGLTRVSNPFRRVTQPKPDVAREGPVSERQVQTEPFPEPEYVQGKNDYAEGKRGPTSPWKNPTPKRRRTLVRVDSEEDETFSDTELKPVQDSHAAMQGAMGRKRKEPPADTLPRDADPDVIAQRQILRPRNPTPNQRMRDEIQAEVLEATEAFLHSSPKVNNIREQLEQIESSFAPGMRTEEAQAAFVANEIAAFTMNRAQVTRKETRKRSVTTQDFLDEAVKIMDYIRAKGRPTSGLGSLEESESEMPIQHDDSLLPDTPLSLSRPPSREGRVSEWREPNKHELDPKVMSHLRKYQEGESDEFMGSSMRSLRVSRMNGQESHEDNSVVIEQGDIRITDNASRHNRDHDDEDYSHLGVTGAYPSVGSSLGNMSRRSEHVATLAPEAVVHLIPEDIAGMHFDREKNRWVRNKSPSKEHRPVEDISSHHESEDDPFGHIPDLTVDETAEIMMKNQESPNKPQPTAETFLDDTEIGKFDHRDLSRPVTRDGKAKAPTESSSVPSKFSREFAWSYPKTETRATSWSDQEQRNAGTQKTQLTSTTYPIPESDEVEHEIQYFEGREAATPRLSNAKIRDITFAIDRHGPNGHNRQQRDVSSQQWSYSSSRQHSRAHKSTWRPGPKTLPPPLRESIPEDSDLPTFDDQPSRNYRMQLSMSLSAPVLGIQKHAMLAAPSSPPKGDTTFMLSDLPEFTLNQVDERELPDRVVVKHDGTEFSKTLEDRYAQGTAQLIKALQDVAPDEPYWEDLRKVNLHEKGLTNLHRLEEYCFRLEELDISNNGISQLTGIPYTIRRLQVQNNQLTGLTSWSTLANLQHLDISGNDIDSLDGLSELVHLRTLKVDNNHIKSLEGILLLDGLMELSACGNEIEVLDFAKAELKSLTDLNLCGNRLTEVRNLHCLPKLCSLDLDDNYMDEFPIHDVTSAPCNALRSLRLCKNGMTTLDIELYCPNVESLYVDGNSLADIPGLEHLKNLRTFSAREQELGNDSDMETCVGNLVRNPDVRNLYISVNPTRILGISQHLLNLQRLELASMGLKELPDNFGQLTPNLRTINLNFNSIEDLRPLLNIKRIGELFVAGNKLSRLRTNMAVLGKLTTLSKLDLRENPITLRFYPPASENRVMSLRNKVSDDSTSDRFVLPDGDAEADQRYLQRLDFETRLRRRVQEIMLSTQCRNLRHLDGLPFDKSRILVKDDIWDRLSFLGVIRKAEVPERITG